MYSSLNAEEIQAIEDLKATAVHEWRFTGGDRFDLRGFACGVEYADPELTESECFYTEFWSNIKRAIIKSSTSPAEQSVSSAKVVLEKLIAFGIDIVPAGYRKELADILEACSTRSIAIFTPEREASGDLEYKYATPDGGVCWAHDVVQLDINEKNWPSNSLGEVVGKSMRTHDLKHPASKRR